VTVTLHIAMLSGGVTVFLSVLTLFFMSRHTLSHLLVFFFFTALVKKIMFVFCVFFKKINWYSLCSEMQPVSFILCHCFWICRGSSCLPWILLISSDEIAFDDYVEMWQMMRMEVWQMMMLTLTMIVSQTSLLPKNS
jgi:hypothetical protein